MTSRTRKLAVLATVVVAVVVAAVAFWPRPKGYTYQGKTVEEWFEQYIKGQSARPAFREMGTNALAFLVGKINRDLSPSWFERQAIRLDPKRKWRSRSKFEEGFVAASILRHDLAVPTEELKALLRPAFESTNNLQNQAALRAISTSGIPTTPPPTSPLP